MANKIITDLQTQIECIHDPREFERLINELFSRLFGTDYIPTRHHIDWGLDGYISSSSTLVAKHCFESVSERKTGSILIKAKKDLDRAKELAKKTDIKRWMFITPYSVPTEVFVVLKKEAKEAGFYLEIPGPSYIATELLKNKDLLQSFPDLHVGQIDENMQSMRETMEAIGNKLDVPVTAKQLDKVVDESSNQKLEGVRDINDSKSVKNAFMTVPQRKDNSKDFKRLLEIYKSPPSAELEKKVRAIIYSSKDQIAVVQGIHLLVSWYEFSRNTVDDFMVFINLGIDTSKTLKNSDSEAILLAEKASLLSTKFVLMDLEGWGDIEISNLTGFPLITDEKRVAIILELKKLNNEFNELSKEAMQKSHASNNYLAVTRTFSIIGSSAGSRAGHFLSLGIKERAVLELGVCKGAFMYAKNIAVQFKDEREMANVLYNFANALGFVDEADEALLVLNEAVVIAKKYHMGDILEKVGRLERLIREPKIRLVKHE